jgi:selenoprotein W-related protein
VAEEILTEHAGRIEGITLVPSAGGRFVVTVGETEVFNKRQTGRFPEPGEAGRLVKEAFA